MHLLRKEFISLLHFILLAQCCQFCTFYLQKQPFTKIQNVTKMATLPAKSHFIYFCFLFSGLCQRLHFSQIAFSTLQMVENGSFSKLLAPFYIFAISLVPRSDFFLSCFKYRRLYTQMLRSRPDLRSHGNSMPS